MSQVCPCRGSQLAQANPFCNASIMDLKRNAHSSSPSPCPLAPPFWSQLK